MTLAASLRQRASAAPSQTFHQQESAFVTAPQGIAITLAGLGVIFSIATVDICLDRNLTLGLFYLLPIAAAAWWAGLSYAVLLSLASVAAWHCVDATLGFRNHPAAMLWNDVIRFLTFAATSSLLYRLHVVMSRETLLAQTDSLTGAINGWTFYQRVLLEVERAGRTRQPLTLAYLDLDHFKQLNDERGHAVGDAALAHLVQTLHANMRATDMLARLGGDEFSLLLPDTEAEGAVQLLQRLQRLVVHEMRRKGWPLTVSIGAATFLSPPADVDALIQRIDALMYGAKKGGKNRINHEVVRDPTTRLTEEMARIEKRVAERMTCQRKTRICPTGAWNKPPGFATIENISTHGIGVLMDEEFPLETLFAMEPFSPCGVRALLARVVRIDACEMGWYYGCELLVPLTPDELKSWTGVPAERSRLVTCPV